MPNYLSKNFKSFKVYISVFILLLLGASALYFGQNLNVLKKLGFPLAAAEVKISQELLDKAKEQGSVAVIIKLADAHTPEVRLNISQKMTQRQKHNENQTKLEQRLRSPNFKVGHKFQQLPLMTAIVTYDDLLRLKSLKGEVLAVFENYPVQMNLDTSGPQIGTPAAYEQGLDGSGQVIAIIDSGIDSSHPFLQRPSGGSKIIGEQCIADQFQSCNNGLASQSGPGSANPCLGTSEEDVLTCAHGTMVAGVAAGINNGTLSGIARGADLISIRVTNPTNESVMCGEIPCAQTLCGTNPRPCVITNMGHVLNGLEWVGTVGVPSYGVDVVNISVGSGALFRDSASCDTDSIGVEFEELVVGLAAQNIPVVAATGNDGLSDQIRLPSCISSVIAAGSLSNLGNMLSSSDRAIFKSPLLFFAPGEAINTSAPGGGFMEGWGTSFAAPHLSGMLAIMKQAKPAATLSELVAALRNGSDRIPDPWVGGGFTDYYRVNLQASLGRLITAGTSSSAVGTTGTSTTWTHADSGGSTLGAADQKVLQGSTFQPMILVTAAYRAAINTGAEVVSATYCGQSLQRVASRVKYQHQTVEMWYGMNPPSNVSGCAVNVNFSADPEDRVLSSTLFFNVDSVNAVASTIAGGNLGSTNLNMSSVGPKDSIMVCTYSNYPNGRANVVTPQINSTWRQFWSFTNTTFVNYNIQSALSSSIQRTNQGQLMTQGWSSVEVLPWAALCANFRVKPFAVVPPPPPPPPVQTPSPVPTPTPATLLPTQTNVLINPGFEGGTANWTFYTNGVGSFAVTSPGSSSNNAARVNIQTVGSNMQLYQSGIRLKPNTRYRLQFSGYSSSGRDLTVSLHRHSSPYTSYGLNNLVMNLTNSWSPYSTEFTTANFTTNVSDARLRFGFNGRAANGDIYFIDNVTLSEVGSVPQPTPVPTPTPIVSPSPIVTPTPTAVPTATPLATNLVSNPGFESGTTNWTFFTNAIGVFTTVQPGFEGVNTGRITIQSVGSNMQFYQAGRVLKPNRRYMLSFNAYSSSGRDMSLSIHRHSSPYTNYGLNNWVPNLSTGWQSFSIQFTTANFTTQVSDARLKFTFNGWAQAGEVYLIDNVRLVEVF